MIDKPMFKSCYHVEVVEPETVILLSERGHQSLRGRLYCLLAPLIDGSRSVGEIVRRLEGQALPVEVFHALMRLREKGYLVEADGSVPSEIAAFWHCLELEAAVWQRRLQETRVTVTSFGAVPGKKWISSLVSLGIEVAQEGDRGVVLTDDYLQDGLQSYNKDALKSDRSWMLIKPVGSILWIGPIFRPEKTGCWECLAHRLRANRPVETLLQEKKRITAPFPTSTAALPSTIQATLGLSTTEVAKWIGVGEHKPLEGIVLTLDLLSLKTETHALIKRPQCSVCGKRELEPTRPPIPPSLQNRKKRFTDDGGHRSVLPETTYEQYKRHISPITGVVPVLAETTRYRDTPLHLYMAGYNPAVRIDQLNARRLGLRSNSAGKGKTDMQARASALCEAIERHSGMFQGDEIRHRSSFAALGKSAIHPNVCMAFSQDQYRHREEWHQGSGRSNWVPVPFDEAAETDWTPLWSLTDHTFKYLPTALCYYDYPLPEDQRFAEADSNGSAAGNSLEEAILQGFMELVERDAVALWWYNRVRRPGVSLESFDEPYFKTLKGHYGSLSRDLWALDITNDLNIPSFVALSRRTDQEGQAITLGFGAHFDARIALLRALTEMNLFLSASESLEQDSQSQRHDRYADLMHWQAHATLENQPYLAADPDLPHSSCRDYSRQWSDDLLEDIGACVRIAASKNLETLILDQTRPDIGLNVVKVFVPGLRHFWKRHAPGRLYDAPVQLGWLEKPLKEIDLNPTPLFV